MQYACSIFLILIFAIATEKYQSILNTSNNVSPEGAIRFVKSFQHFQIQSDQNLNSVFLSAIDIKEDYPTIQNTGPP